MMITCMHKEMSTIDSSDNTIEIGRDSHKLKQTLHSWRIFTSSMQKMNVKVF
jgi:hypothetical protein